MNGILYMYNTQQLGTSYLPGPAYQAQAFIITGNNPLYNSSAARLPGTARHVHHSLHWEQYAVYSLPLSFEIIHRAQHFSVPLGQYFMYVHHLSKSKKYVKYHMLFCCTSCTRMYKICFLGTAPMLRTPFLSTVENTQGSLSVRIGDFPLLTGALSLLSEKSKPCASLL